MMIAFVFFCLYLFFTMSMLPYTYTKENTTGCCPVFNVQDRQDKTVTFTDERFLVGTTRNFLYVPINMKQMMGRIRKKIQEEDAAPEQERRMMLSEDISPRKTKHYFLVTKDIEGGETTTLSGTYRTRVFEGPYKNMKFRTKEMVQSVEDTGASVMKLLAFYTTCPSCAKAYGKNYVALLAKIQ